jgi:hypothetical protein
MPCSRQWFFSYCHQIEEQRKFLDGSHTAVSLPSSSPTITQKCYQVAFVNINIDDTLLPSSKL